MAIEFEDYSFKVKEAIHDGIIAYIYEVVGEIQTQAARNTPVRTGRSKESWDYEVNEQSQEGIVGSPLEELIWNEFGTGQYALHGDGRKTPWKYKDINGKWHTTTGKRPRRSFFKAFESVKPNLPTILSNKLKEFLK